MSEFRSFPSRSPWARFLQFRHHALGRIAQYCRISTVVIPLAVLLSGCLGGKAHPGYAVATGGSADRGKQVIEHYECGQCHTIPGIHHAKGVFGPPLIEMGARTTIAGNFPNVPENMVHWVQAPTSMKPKTAMPDLGLSDQQARDVAAYLETLR